MQTLLGSSRKPVVVEILVISELFQITATVWTCCPRLHFLHRL